MARTESDREDLILEAAGLPDRAEWRIPTEPAPVVTGIKRDGGLCIYFDADPVYQFAPDGGLRRAFVNGLLYRTQGHTLACLTRTRLPAGDAAAPTTTLLRRDLDPAQLEQFLAVMTERLSTLNDAFLQGRVSLLRCAASDASGRLPDFGRLLDGVLAKQPHLAPPYAGRRQ